MDFNFRTGFRIVNLLMLIAATGLSVNMWLGGLVKKKFDDDKGMMVSKMDNGANVSYFLPEHVLQNLI